MKKPPFKWTDNQAARLLVAATLDYYGTGAVYRCFVVTAPRADANTRGGWRVTLSLVPEQRGKNAWTAALEDCDPHSLAPPLPVDIARARRIS